MSSIANIGCLLFRVGKRSKPNWFVQSILASSAVVAFSTAAALAQDAPSPSPSESAVPNKPADPCGDSNLLATTDRPTFGTNPCVVKTQESVLEFGYRNTITSGTGASATSTYPENRSRFGLRPNLELVVDTPTLLRVSENGSTAFGVSNIGTGLKYEIGYFGGFVHGFAAEVVLPTGDTAFTNGHSSYNGSYQIGGGIFKNVGFNLTLGFNNSTVQTPGHNGTVTAFAPTLIVGGKIAPDTKLNVEVAGSSANGGGTSGQYFGNVFLQHQFAKYLLLDIEAEQRLTVVSGGHQHYIGAGGSVRL